MRSRIRLLSIALLVIPFFALPAIGYAAGSAGTKQGTEPLSDSGAKVTLPGGATVAAPSLVSGATIRTVGSDDAVINPISGGTIEAAAQPGDSGAYFVFNSNGGNVMAPLGLPAGATIWQVDIYGYSVNTTYQSWSLYDEDATIGNVASAQGIYPGSGSGILHGTYAPKGGQTLAAGHDWQIVLGTTSNTSGFLGAVIQYTLPTLSFVPITPTRVLDTRNGTGGLSGHTHQPRRPDLPGHRRQQRSPGRREGRDRQPDRDRPDLQRLPVHRPNGHDQPHELDAQLPGGRRPGQRGDGRSELHRDRYRSPSWLRATDPRPRPSST